MMCPSRWYFVRLVYRPVRSLVIRTLGGHQAAAAGIMAKVSDFMMICCILLHASFVYYTLY